MTLEEINWAWSYENDKEEWIQFDCTECILIEYAFHQYIASQMNLSFQYINTLDG